VSSISRIAKLSTVPDAPVLLFSIEVGYGE